MGRSLLIQSLCPGLVFLADAVSRLLTQSSPCPALRVVLYPSCISFIPALLLSSSPSLSPSVLPPGWKLIVG